MDASQNSQVRKHIDSLYPSSCIAYTGGGDDVAGWLPLSVVRGCGDGALGARDDGDCGASGTWMQQQAAAVVVGLAPNVAAHARANGDSS